jgi:LmbE family N-acetylglucosaminyl deacetylase
MIPLMLSSEELHIVCLGAHPDDVEIGCGGTLLRLAGSGCKITATVVVATGAGERYDEAMKAAPRFLPGADVDVQVFDLRDGFLPAAWEAVKEGLEAVARSATADIIFAPRLDDAHQDHRVVAEIVSTVWRDALVMRYEIPKWDGDLGRVTHYVSLEAETAQRKVDLLDESFASQVDRGWWDSETFLGLLRLRGVECRSRYAEGFLVDKAVLDLG